MQYSQRQDDWPVYPSAEKLRNYWEDQSTGSGPLQGLFGEFPKRVRNRHPEHRVSALPLKSIALRGPLRVRPDHLPGEVVNHRFGKTSFTRESNDSPVV
jgi:hypothetical protein